MLEHVREITYRGSLKSCNYTCSYCPFGKKKHIPEALKRDKAAWNQFCDMIQTLKSLDPVSILIAPYGEAMIHDYYRESLAELSKKPFIKAIGCQTNLSFSAEVFLHELKARKADVQKISLWATFHPEMTEIETFVRQVEQLSPIINLSVGVVGNPACHHVIQKLRKQLPSNIYLWVNGMDGLGRKYTQEENGFYQSIDPMFFWEVGRRKDNSCISENGHIFVTADGSLYPCNRMPKPMGNLYDSELTIERRICSGARCDCYLAYSHTPHFLKQRFFGEKSLFRIPERRQIKALFLDVDGTLIGKDGKISEEIRRTLQYLATHIPLFFATELPVNIALRKCGLVRNLFSGGCFLGGAHCVHWKTGFEISTPLPYLPEKIRDSARSVDMQGDTICRMLLPGNIAVSDEFDKSIQSGGIVSLVKKGTDKYSGIKKLCEHLGIDLLYVMAVGNDLNDCSMIRECGYGVAVLDSAEELKQEADYVLAVHQLAYIL